MKMKDATGRKHIAATKSVVNRTSDFHALLQKKGILRFNHRLSPSKIFWGEFRRNSQSDKSMFHLFQACIHVDPHRPQRTTVDSQKSFRGQVVQWSANPNPLSKDPTRMAPSKTFAAPKAVAFDPGNLPPGLSTGPAAPAEPPPVKR